MRLLVLGCGVSGLSTGIRLLEDGHEVTIWARELPPHTTSDVAAAIWYPYRAYPRERVLSWGERSFAVLCELAQTPETGVRLMEGIEYFTKRGPLPWWKGSARSFRPARGDELPAGYVRGYVFEVPAIEMPVYLRYLISRFRDLGGSIVQRSVRWLSEVPAESPAVVNCTGVGASRLVQDAALYPIRGQVVRVEPLPVGRFLLDLEDEHDLTYIVPRSQDCILGGTDQPHNGSLEPDPATRNAILDRCARLVPEVRRARVLEDLVGLRPGRNRVRVEACSRPDGGLVIHNYGHGGAGITLSWGCAEEVVALVRQQA